MLEFIHQSPFEDGWRTRILWTGDFDKFLAGNLVSGEQPLVETEGFLYFCPSHCEGRREVPMMIAHPSSIDNPVSFKEPAGYAH